MRRVTQRMLGMALGLLVWLGASGAALAAEATVCPLCGRVRGNAATYQTKAGTTLVRGTLNTLFGWTEMIRQPAIEAKEGGSVLTGIGKGIGQGVQRTASGLGEICTFWAPKVHEKYLHLANDCPLCMGQKPKP